MALSDHHMPLCLYNLVTTSPYLLQPLTWMQYVLLTWLNDVTTNNITIWMTFFPMVCFLQTVKQLKCDNPLLRCRISCSSGPHQHCTILKHRENFTFTDRLSCFQILFYLALTKETDLKEIKLKHPWTHHTHIRTTKTLSYKLHAKAALPPRKDSLIPKE